MDLASQFSPELPKRCSLIAETLQTLIEGIQSGYWKDYLPGERELSERLQVSRPTLRSALEELQGKGWISIASRRRTRILTRDGEEQRSGERKIISVLCSDHLANSSTQGTFMIDVLRDKLSKAGCEVEFHSSRACFSSRPSRALEKLVKAHPSAAWMVLGSREPTQRWFYRQDSSSS